MSECRKCKSGLCSAHNPQDRQAENAKLKKALRNTRIENGKLGVQFIELIEERDHLKALINEACEIGMRHLDYNDCDHDAPHCATRLKEIKGEVE